MNRGDVERVAVEGRPRHADAPRSRPDKSISPESATWFNAHRQDILRNLSRHVVTLQWSHSLRAARSDTGDKLQDFDTRTEFAPAFLLEAGESCLLVTAGHLVTGLVSTTSQDRQLVEAYMYVGLHRDGPADSVALPLARVPYFPGYDESRGLDYGTFLLTPELSASIAATGSEPLRRGDWEEPLDRIDTWALLACPPGSRSEAFVSDAVTTTAALRADTSLLPLERMRGPETRAIEASDGPFRASVATCLHLVKGESISLHDASGMTGPVFAFQVDGGQCRYRLMAVQGTGIKDDVVEACTVSSFVSDLQQRVVGYDVH